MALNLCSPSGRVRSDGRAVSRLVRRLAVVTTLVVALVVPVSGIARAATTQSVTNTNDSGPGSLRQALLNANAAAGQDTIEFSITGTGPHTIMPTSALPPIIDPVVIDATTQPGYASCGAGPMIEVDGSLAPNANGFWLAAPSTVRGLAINNFGSPGRAGILASSPGGHVLECNFLGSNATGTAAKPNTIGVFMTSPTTIGGSSAGARNVISGNTVGIYASSLGGTIQGNYIGTDATGTTAIGNGEGITLDNAASVVIGGTGPGSANVISGNSSYGVRIGGPDNIVQGNLIGTAADGTSPLGNASSGVHIGPSGGAHGNQVGGTAAAAGNVIAYNGDAGVAVQDSALDVVGNAILGNAIHDNVGLGIRLTGTVTANDTGDGDDGANHFQNFPTLSNATSGTPGSVTGTLDSGTGSFRIEFFKSTACDALGNGEGATYLGTLDTTSNMPFLFNANLTAGDVITATATAPDSSTSEFSECRSVVAATPPYGSNPVVNSAADQDDGACQPLSLATSCTLREAINLANGVPGVDTISFHIPGVGPHTIRPTSPLPSITDPTIIDGTTQPGAVCPSNLLVELDGSLLASGSPNGLEISAGSSTVRGLVINRFRGNGIALEMVGGNTVQCNLIGTDLAGTTARGNGGSGVATDHSPNNTIGGTSAGMSNVLSGNGVGITLAWDDGGSNVVRGNLIGTDVTGTMAVGNVSGGTFVSSPDNLIGGTGTGARNVISGNGDNGMVLGIITGTHVTGTRIEGNFIGTDAAGATALGNLRNGIAVSDGGVVIGGTSPGAGNLISGNLDRGMYLSGDGSAVQGNLIGTDATGALDLGNGRGGVAVLFGTNTMVGGSSAAAGNVISGNEGPGVSVNSDPAAGNIVAGNRIGTRADGTGAIGNVFGVVLESQGTTVGGTDAGSGNIIANSLGDGVLASGGTAHVLGNSIHSNGRLGINLGVDAVTPNDVGDTDTGRQNFPVLTSASPVGATTTVAGTLSSVATATYRVELFSNTICDASGNGEGQTFLGFTTVITDASGDGTFTATGLPSLAAGENVTATATDDGGNTSEFSACRAAAATVQTFPLTVVTAGGGGGSVASSPVGIECGVTCSANFDADAVVSLTATPAADSTFTGWSGGGCPATGVCEVTMSAAQSVTATFARIQFGLSVTKTGTGGGSVSSSPPGITCGTTCGATFDAGSLVTLTATPSAGSTFAGWSVASCSASSTCQISLRADMVVTATFTQPALFNASAISAGSDHTCAIQSGAAMCWGYNGTGQLGNGSIVAAWSPVPVAGLSSAVTAISAGGEHTCAIQAGAAKCWGSNGNRQLGNNSTDPTPTLRPVNVIGLGSGVTAIAAGQAHTCAVQSGAAKCWGNGGDGQLGNNRTDRTPTARPVDVIGLGSGVTAIAAAFNHTCAIQSGAVKCWGYNGTGQLGNNTTKDESTPVAVIGLGSGVTALDADGYQTCAIQNGGVKCWGYNGTGMLGNRSTDNALKPVDAIGLGSGVTAIAAGYVHVCAVQYSVMSCWGDNGGGQLGVGDYTRRLEPVPVIDLGPGVTAIAPGGGHTCAIQSIGVKCWGAGGSGQLGARSWNSSNAPPTVPIEVDAVRVTTGVLLGGGSNQVTTGAVLALHPLSTTVGASGAVGPVSISEAPTDATSALSGYQFFGYQATISAPTGTIDQPLVLTFQLDASIMPPGLSAVDTIVVRNGSRVPTCTDPAVVKAAPTPCVASATGSSATGMSFTVYTVAASQWQFAVRDTTAPTITFVGDTTYTVDQAVIIGCFASDTFRLATTTCPSVVNAPAYTFALGSNRASASATDAAGNSRTASVSFVVQVTPPSLCALTKAFVQGSAKYLALKASQRAPVDVVTNAACQLLNSITPKLTAKEKAVRIIGYKVAVQVLAGGGYMTKAQATTLTGLANAI